MNYVLSWFFRRLVFSGAIYGLIIGIASQKIDFPVFAISLLLSGLTIIFFLVQIILKYEDIIEILSKPRTEIQQTRIKTDKLYKQFFK